LNTEQLGRTRAELRANLERTGLTEAQVLADLRWSAERLDAALHATGSADPVDVWELRDYLERAVRDAGGTPVPFTILTAGNRLRARMWFRLRKAPRHDYSGA
jgi:hypothetical protein